MLIHWCYENNLEGLGFKLTISISEMGPILRTCILISTTNGGPMRNKDIYYIQSILSNPLLICTSFLKIKLEKLGWTNWIFSLQKTGNTGSKIKFEIDLGLVFLLISNLTSWLRLHQFLGTKTTVLERPFPFLEHPLLF